MARAGWGQALRALLRVWVAALAVAVPAWAEAPRKVRLHLKWAHQFQFAGYYAAQAKGFYREAGLEVELVEAGPGRLPVPTVEGGAADFGVSGVEAFQAYLEGRPLVALGVVFQHSPNILLSLRSKGILRPADLAGRRVMFQGGQGQAEAQAMLMSEGLRLDAVQQVPHSWDLEDLIQGRADAISAYTTNEPFLLGQRGVETSQLRPIEYGVDFYGDLLFTTRDFAHRNPELVAAFAEASFRGWDYAMEHPDELVEHILTLPGVAARGRTREGLRFEAARMRDLILPGLVDVGHMNPGRFRRIADILVRLGMVRTVRDPEGFIHAPDQPGSRAWVRGLKFGLPAAAALGLLGVLWITLLRRQVFARTRELLREVQQRKRTEAALRESEERFRVLFEGAPDPILLADPDTGRIVDANRAACRLLGREREAILGMAQHELHPPRAADFSAETFARHLQEAQAQGRTLPIENTVLRPDGSEVPVEVLAQLIRVGDQALLMGTFRDVTERRRFEDERRQLQAQLHQAQKMESLGSLAGGVAHDMNNVLGAILGMASLHEERAEPGSPLRRGLATIGRAAERGATLVKGLLNFARQNPGEERELDLNTILREEVRLLERTTLAQVQLELDLDPALQPVRGDAGALTHAFMNLCVNAVDAMAGTGTLHLRTRNLGRDWVEVAVEDTGCGMPPEVREKAFDPFFTTKAQGKGTGLGLSIVYGTVKAHRGHIDLQSEPGLGTRVTLRFPACLPAPPVAEGGAPAMPPVPGRALRLLLVDDDELVRESVQAMLTGLGHAVVAAASGEEGLARLEEGPLPDAVLLDMNMPGLGGAGTLPLLRQRAPDLPVFLATGRADQGALDLAAAHPGVRLLPKPFSLDALRRELDRLDPPGPA